LGNFRVFNRVLTDDEIDRSWMYISYRYGRMKYTNWNGGEPNNSGGEDYIQFVTSGRWNDLPNTSLPYVIEFDYIVTTTPWTVHSTSTTSNGRVTYSYPTDPSKEYYVEVTVPTTTSTISSDDYSYLSDVFLGKTSLKSYHYHQWDLNMDGSISVSDLLYLIKSVLGLQSWVNQTYLFTQSEWNSLNANTTNLTTTIQGNTTTYTFNINSGGTTNLYLLTKGFGDQSQVRYQ
jgi:hypothetical protein